MERIARASVVAALLSLGVLVPCWAEEKQDGARTAVQANGPPHPVPAEAEPLVALPEHLPLPSRLFDEDHGIARGGGTHDEARNVDAPRRELGLHAAFDRHDEYAFFEFFDRAVETAGALRKSHQAVPALKLPRSLFHTLHGFDGVAAVDRDDVRQGMAQLLELHGFLVVDAAAGDFRLAPGSPAIDAARSDIAGWPELDADRMARVDDPSTPNTGAGPVAYADRGALEYQTNQAPVVTAPPTATVAENELLTVEVSASDPDGDAITSLTAVGLPSGASFTPGPGNTTGTLTWTPDFTQAGSYSVAFVAANTLSGTDTTEITVTGSDRAPVVTAPDTVSVSENALLTVDVSATDPDGSPIDSLTATGVPAGASFAPGPGHTSGTLTWTPSFSQAGVYTITFVAHNSLNGADTTAITVINTDRPPVVTSPAAASVMASDSLSFVVTAVDPDGDPIDSLTVVGLPAGASFVATPGDTNGTFRWTPAPSQVGNHVVTFLAANALQAADTTEITVAPSTTDVEVRPMAGLTRPPRGLPRPDGAGSQRPTSTSPSPTGCGWARRSSTGRRPWRRSSAR